MPKSVPHTPTPRPARRWAVWIIAMALAAGSLPVHAGPEEPDPELGPADRRAVREDMDKLRLLPGDGPRHRLELLAAVTGVTPPGEPDPHAGLGTILPAGDLTGDGLEDLIEDRPVVRTVAGVRGSDGSSLWTFDWWTFDWAPGEFFWGRVLAAGDLTGNGLSDVLVARYAHERTAVGVARSERWTLTLWALRGSDGGVLWTRSITGTLAAVELEVFSCWACARARLDFPTVWDLPGDLDGDGAPDLLIRRPAEGQTEGVLPQVTRRWAGGALFEAVSGRTGATVAAFPAVAAYTSDWGCFASCPDAVGIPDLTGDGLPDVVVLSTLANEAPFGSFEGALAAYPGTGGAPVWSALHTGSEPPTLTGADLTGDGRGDVLTLARTSFTTPATWIMEAISGEDGSRLWTGERQGLSMVAPVGDVTGDGGTELLVAGGGMAVLHAGATGAPVWEHPYQGMKMASDLTQDGVRDFLVRPGPFDWELRSSADAGLVWTTEATTLYDLGRDLDEDGTPDLLATFRVDGEDSAAVLSGATGDPIWNDNGPVALGGRATAVLAGDLREAGHPDIVVSLAAEAGVGVRKAARDGRTGSLLWTRSRSS